MAANKQPSGAEELTLAGVRAQIDEMLENARAEAQRLRAEAEKIVEEAREASGLTAAQDKKAIDARRAEQIARGEEYVEGKLFKDNGKYKDDVFVSVNGENCLIRRGERVRIKRKFAEVLDNSDKQDYETSRLIDDKSAEFEEKSNSLN